VRVAYRSPWRDPGGLTLLFVTLLLGLAVVAATTLAGVFGHDVETLTPQVAALVSSDGSRLDALGGLEVARVGAAINALLDRVARHHVDSFLAVEKLEEARRLKSQFLANMSHDLRSPLNSILGFSELLIRGLDGEVAEADRARLVQVQHDGRRLLRLINQILDTAKCESGKMVPNPQPVTPAEVISQAVQELRRGPDLPTDIELQTELQPGMAPVQVDPLLLPQAVAHLLDYAYGAAERGPKPGRVRVVVSDRRIGKGRVFIVEVTWSGPAPVEDRERLFVGFRRTGPGDLGLGLPLARRLVELHGGSLGFGEGEAGRLAMTVPVAPHRERLGVLRRKTAKPA
jgi:signal transduction histidine kinase